MAVINLNDRLVGAGSTDTLEAYGLRVGGGGLTVRNAGKAPVLNLTRSSLTTAGDLVYTAAQLAGGIILRDPNGGARGDSFDTAANIISGCGLSADGDTVVCYLVNMADAAETITLSAGGAGVTLDNFVKTLAQDKECTLLITRTSSTAVSITILGNG